jgi:hypothetical protein
VENRAESDHLALPGGVSLPMHRAAERGLCAPGARAIADNEETWGIFQQTCFCQAGRIFPGPSGFSTQSEKVGAIGVYPARLGNFAGISNRAGCASGRRDWKKVRAIGM